MDALDMRARRVMQARLIAKKKKESVNRVNSALTEPS
jgi:hypothetical protein